MKADKRSLNSKVWIVCAVLCGVSISYSVNPQANADPKKASANTGAANNSPPQAVFKVPTSLQEGLRDPFFPKSTYFVTQPLVPQPIVTAPALTRVELKLQGMSGPLNHRLPIINGRTFEVGEEAEVNTSSGRVSVRCIEIREDTVTVMVNGQRQELKMRQGV